MTRLRLSLSLLLLSGSLAACEIVAGIQDLQQGSTFDVPDTGTPRDSSAGYGDGAGSSSSSSSHFDGGADAKVPPRDGAPDAPAEAEAGDGANGDGTVSDAPTDAPVQDGTSGDADATTSIDGGDAATSADARADADADAAPVNTELIDDLETNTGHIIVTHGRSGSWFTYNDQADGGPGVQTPAVGTRFLPTNAAPQLPNSVYAARTNGSGFAMFVGMGFTLNDPPSGPDAGVRSPYDASGYLGLSFYARVAAGTSAHIRVEIPDMNTDSAGGICVACSDYFGAEFDLTSSWTQYFAYFKDLRTQNFGSPQPAALAANAIYGIQFQITAGSGANVAPLTFDLWVDNVAFVTP